MADRLRIFISSTVKDFRPVRADLRRWLHARDVEVRASEDDRFPVAENVSSHGACLHAVEGCHVFVLLLGDRWGGPYEATEKSITRREFEEALDLQIPTICLVRRDVNDLAVQWSRRELVDPPFKDTDKVVDFIDFVRKDRKNNWFHSTWDGSFYEARTIIQARLHGLLTSYQAPHRDLVRRAEGLAAYARARQQLDQLAVALNGKLEQADRARVFLEKVAEHRQELMGFRDGDRWSLAVYTFDTRSSVLEVLARAKDESIPLGNRPWAVGEGHVGLAWQARETLIAGDLSITTSWKNPKPTDEENYVSAVAEPVVGPDEGAEVRAVLVVTSSRRDHFLKADQHEVLTVRSVGLMLLRLL